MNKKELKSLRTRYNKPGRHNIKTIYGCYVDATKNEITSTFARSTAKMGAAEEEDCRKILKRIIGGGSGSSLGKNLLDITFRTEQVQSSPEHTLLMSLRGDGMENEENRNALFEKIKDSLVLGCNYVILLCTENYDLPPRRRKKENLSEDTSEEVFTYFLCAICPVKEKKQSLQYNIEDKNIADGKLMRSIGLPELGILFPAFDDFSTNIYNALYYTRNTADNREKLVESIFNTEIAVPAATQKEDFSSMLASSLGDECSIDVIAAIQSDIRQQMKEHKGFKNPEPLTLGKEELCNILDANGVSEEHQDEFKKQYDQTFGKDSLIYAQNILETKKVEIVTNEGEITIRASAEYSDLIETRVIGGIKYILIKADDGASINGIALQIEG